MTAMTRQIRFLGAALMLCFLVLFAQLNRLMVLDASTLNEHPENTREILRDFNRARGSITTADGVLVAESVPSDGRFDLQRLYPEGPRYAHITGFYSFSLGSSGLERTYNDELAGRTLDLQLRDLTDLFVDRERTGNLTLSIRDDLQRIAEDQLGERRGSVVAVDPRTGELLALWSFPSYDPNALADHDTARAAEVQTLLDASAERPRRSRAYQERFFPGSTYKVVTAAAGLASGEVTLTDPDYPRTNEYVAPGTTRPLRNFGGGTCGGQLVEILRVSCNTAFAQMGVDVGPEPMIGAAEAFGFNQDVPIDLTDPVRSVYPTDFDQNLPALAQSAIGQHDVSATPLQMALVAAAVANEGRIMEPRAVVDVRDADGTVVSTNEPSEWRRAIDAGTATILRDAMVDVVEQGTASRLAIPNMLVGGKTGTAQLGTDPPRSHAWIIGFAGPPGEPAHVAVAVIIEGQPGASEQTGGQVAAPIAQAIMAAALAPPADGAPDPDDDEAPEGDDDG
jgi:penicillin-binding protein A